MSSKRDFRDLDYIRWLRSEIAKRETALVEIKKVLEVAGIG